MRLAPPRLSAFLICLGFALTGCETRDAQSALGRTEAALSRPVALSPEATLEAPTFRPDLWYHRIHSAVFNGQDWVVLHAGYEARLTRISSAGDVRDIPGLNIADRFYYGHDDGALATDGAATAVALMHGGDVWFHRYDRALSPLAEPLKILREPYSNRGIAMAHGGGEYLVVWAAHDSNQQYVRGARVTAQGVLLDTTPLELARRTRVVEYPRAVWDGQRFLVVWSEHDEGSTSTAPSVVAAHVETDGRASSVHELLASARDADVCMSGDTTTVVAQNGQTAGGLALRLTRDLAPVDAEPIALPAAEGAQSNVRCAMAGDTTLISWTDYDRNYFDRASACTLSAKGELGPAFRLADAFVQNRGEFTHADMPVTMASDGEHVLALWAGGGTRVTAAGQALDGSRIVAAQTQTGQHAPKVALDGDSGLVLFADERPVTNYEHGSLRVQRVSSAGTPLDIDSTLLVEPAGEYTTTELASDGKGYLAMWSEWWLRPTHVHPLRAMHITRDGTPQAGEPTIVQDDDQVDSMDLAASRDGYLAVWTNWQEVYGRRLKSDGSAEGQRFLIAKTNGYDNHVRAVFDGESYIVAWCNEETEGYSLRMNRVTTGGAVLYPEARRVTEPRVAHDLYLTTDFELAAGADGTYVLWQDRPGGPPRLRGTWFDREGQALHPQGKVVPGALRPEAVAFDGSGFTLLGMQEDYTLVTTRVDARGLPLGGSLEVAENNVYSAHLATTSDGRALIVYPRADAEEPYQGRIRTRVLGPPASDVEYDGGLPGAEDGGLSDAGDGSLSDAGGPAMTDDAGPSVRSDAGSSVSVDAGESPIDDGGPHEAASDAAVERGDESDADGAPSTALRKSGGCSCAVVSAPAADRGFGLIALMAYLAFRRRRDRATA